MNENEMGTGNTTPSVQPSEPANQKKGINKILIIVGAIVLIILALAIGVFFYIKTTFTAEKFIDNNVKDINKWISDAFNAASPKLKQVDYTKDDIVTSGTLKINSDEESLKFLNDLSIDFNNSLSLKNEYDVLSLDLKNKNNSALKGDIYLNKEEIYIDSKDVATYALKLAENINVFKELNKNYLETLNTLNTNKLEEFVQNIVKYMGEALKEADMTTTSNGLTVELKYNITEENTTKITEKFKSLLEADETYKELSETIKSMEESEEVNVNSSIEYEDLEPISVVITVNILTNNIKDIKITTDDANFKTEKIGDNTYKFGTKDEYIVVEFGDKYIEIQEKAASQAEVTTARLEKGKNSLTMSIKDQDVNVVITLNKDGDNNEIKMDINSTDLKVNGTISINTKSDHEYDMDIDIKTTVSGTSLSAKINTNTKYDESLVEVKKIDNAKDINSLTEAETSEITNNLYTKLNESGLVDAFSNLIGSGDSFDNTYSGI